MISHLNIKKTIYCLVQSVAYRLCCLLDSKCTLFEKVNGKMVPFPVTGRYQGLISQLNIDFLYKNQFDDAFAKAGINDPINIDDYLRYRVFVAASLAQSV